VRAPPVAAGNFRSRRRSIRYKDSTYRARSWQLSCGAQYLALCRIAPDVRFQLSLVRRSTARELSGYCFGLAVMSLSMLLVTGFDLVLVGHFEFAVVAPYSVAASMITLSGLLFAIINVIMPHAATLHAREKAEAMGRLVITSTRLNVLLLVLTGIQCSSTSGRSFISGSVSAMSRAGRQLLAVLIVANIIRLIGAPYSVSLSPPVSRTTSRSAPYRRGEQLHCEHVLGSLFGGIGRRTWNFVWIVSSASPHTFGTRCTNKPGHQFSRRDLWFPGCFLRCLDFPIAGDRRASWLWHRNPAFRFCRPAWRPRWERAAHIRTQGFFRERFNPSGHQGEVC